MSQDNLLEPDIMKRFDKKIETLKEILPPLGRNRGTSCAAVTLTNILDVLNVEDLKSSYFNNLAIPFSGLALFVGKEGWKGACGVISGSVSAIGIIMGGQEKTRDLEVPNVYGKAIRFATKFEERFGALTCEELCGVNLKENLREYVKNRLWEKKCCNFVSFAIDQVRKITRKELKNKWEK